MFVMIVTGTRLPNSWDSRSAVSASAFSAGESLTMMTTLRLFWRVCGHHRVRVLVAASERVSHDHIGRRFRRYLGTSSGARGWVTLRG